MVLDKHLINGLSLRQTTNTFKLFGVCICRFSQQSHALSSCLNETLVCYVYVFILEMYILNF